MMRSVLYFLPHLALAYCYCFFIPFLSPLSCKGTYRCHCLVCRMKTIFISADRRTDGWTALRSLWHIASWCIARPRYKYTDNVKIGGSSTTVVQHKVTRSAPAGDDSFLGSEQKPQLCPSAWACSSSPLTPQRTKCGWSNCTFRCCAVLPCSLFIMHENWIYSCGADSFFLDYDT